MTDDGLIYLATPYSDPDPVVMERRFNEACQIAGELMARGKLIFCPIAHTHPIAVRCELPRGWEFWNQYDRVMLAASQELWVIKMDGWQKSKGISGEIVIAQELGLPIRYVDPELVCLA